MSNYMQQLSMKKVQFPPFPHDLTYILRLNSNYVIKITYNTIVLSTKTKYKVLGMEPNVKPPFCLIMLFQQVTEKFKNYQISLFC